MDHRPFTRAQLLERGIDAQLLKQMLACNDLQRVHRGWFGHTSTPSAAVQALRLGGRLGCLSACIVHTLWVPPVDKLHVMLNPGAPRPRAPAPGVLFHPLRSPCHTAIATVEQSVDHVLHRHDEEIGLIVLESAVNLGLISAAHARYLATHGTGRKHNTGQHFSPTAQSGSETRLRLFFQRRGVPVTPQKYIEEIGRVDLLVGKSWILEADGAAFHSSAQAVHHDRDRDLLARELGYYRDRLSYPQIWDNWERTQLYLQSMLRTRRHSYTPRPLRW